MYTKFNDFLIFEHKGDLMKQVVIVMGLPGCGKSTFIKNKLKKYVPVIGDDYTIIDSDIPLEKHQRDSCLYVAEYMFDNYVKQGTNPLALLDNNRKTFFKDVVKKLQKEYDEKSLKNETVNTNFDKLDYNFFQPYIKRVENAKPEYLDYIKDGFINAFKKEYRNTIFVSDFSRRELAKEDKLNKVKEVFDKETFNNVIIPINGSIDTILDYINQSDNESVVSVVYLDIPIEKSIENDSKRPRSLGERLICRIEPDVTECAKEIEDNFENSEIYRYLHFKYKDDGTEYGSYVLEEDRYNKEMLKRISAKK